MIFGGGELCVSSSGMFTINESGDSSSLPG